MKKGNKVATIIFLVIAVSVLGGLFAFPRAKDPARTRVSAWEDAGIICNKPQAQQLQHFHPRLEITVDGSRVTIPSDLGIVPQCHADLHTHDSSGVIHVESASATKKFTLGQFFAVWGEPFDRSGYALEMKVNGQPSTEGANLILEDNQVIELSYTNAAQ